jgi:hypothetical protein
MHHVGVNRMLSCHPSDRGPWLHRQLNDPTLLGDAPPLPLGLFRFDYR